MRPLSLRTNQVLLVIGTALPFIALAVWLSLSLLDYNQKTLAAGAVNRLRAFMSAVDAELRGGIASLQALAVSERLGSDDLRGFHREATRFLQFQPRMESISVTAPDGQVVMSTSVPFGERLPATYDRKSFDKVLATRAPVTGDLVLGGGVNRYVVNVRVPILRNGNVAYVLSASISTETFAKLIEQQQLEAGWVSGLVDSEGRFVARKPARPAGDFASKQFMAAVAAADEGWYRGRTVEGLDTFNAHLKSDFSHWSVGLGIPSKEVYAAASSVVWLMGIGFLTSLGIAFAFAYWMGRRISSPISSLAAAARALGGATVPPLPTDSDIHEVAELASTLKEAALAVRERQQLLEREKESLQATDRAKDEFLAMLSHELRNPLAVLTTSVHIMRISKPGDELTVKAQAVIERQLKQMTRLIEDLLDVSRVTMGKASLKREAFDLAELVGRVISAWRPAQTGGRTVSLDAQQVWISADRARIEQVLTNLLDNAQKFSPADKPIRVSVARVKDEAVLTVADEGEGIDPSMLERVFGLFVQGQQGSDRARGGMGVGLALVKRLIELHDGTVTAASAGQGSGAAFTVRLAAAPKPTGEPAPPSVTRKPNPQRILIIEDNPDGREMLRAALTLDGHVVRTAPDGRTGVYMFVEADPDIVFIDIGLPDIDGYEVAARLRADKARRRVVLVALTGYGQSHDEDRAAGAGFDMHLVKPVTADQLRQVIGALESSR